MHLGCLKLSASTLESILPQLAKLSIIELVSIKLFGMAGYKNKMSVIMRTFCKHRILVGCSTNILKYMDSISFATVRKCQKATKETGFQG